MKNLPLKGPLRIVSSSPTGSPRRSPRLKGRGGRRHSSPVDEEKAVLLLSVLESFTEDERRVYNGLRVMSLRAKCVLRKMKHASASK